MKKCTLAIVLISISILTGCTKVDSKPINDSTQNSQQSVNNEPQDSVESSPNKSSDVDSSAFKELLTLSDGHWSNETAEVFISANDGTIAFKSESDSFTYSITSIESTSDLAYRDYDDFNYLMTCDCDIDELMMDIPFTIDGPTLSLEVYGDLYILTKN